MIVLVEVRREDEEVVKRSPEQETDGLRGAVRA